MCINHIWPFNSVFSLPTQNCTRK